MKPKLSKGEFIIGAISLTLCFVIVGVVALMVLPKPAHAYEYVPIIADNPKANTTGTYALEGGLCFAWSFGLKKLFDSNNASQYDWTIPILPIAVALLMHSVPWQYGGQNSQWAWQEQGWMSVGALTPVVIRFDLPRI